MFWALLAVLIAGVASWVILPPALMFFGVRFAKKHLLGEGSGEVATNHRLPGRTGELVPASARTGCPTKERDALRKLEKRLVVAHQQCERALDTKLSSDLARARVAPPLEEAYAQIAEEIESIYAFCARNDLVGTLKKASVSTTAKDIYLEAYARDLAKVQEAIDKTEECLAAYERTVATLEVSSVESDISSDFDASIEMLRDLRDELPRYSLEDRI